jgi:maleylacetate reductase
MTNPFVYNALPQRVVFGAGSLVRVREEVEALDAKRALVLCTPQQTTQAETVAQLLGSLSVGIHDGAVMHVPVEAADKAVALARERGADICVAVGGGSTIGLGKAIALRDGLPVLAVPTTYAGSEMTPIWGMTEAGLKTTGRDVRVLPKTVIYDPELTYGLPAAVSGPSGMNAIAHAVEALYSETANPVVSLMAEESIRALGRALPDVVAEPDNADARSDALYGAWLAGSCLGSVGMALHHKLCHTLGGSFNLPHAEVHTVVIPYAAAYNEPAAPLALSRVAKALGSVRASDGLYDLAQAVGARTALRDIGMKREDLDKAADIATRNPYFNPRPVTRDGIRDLLEQAWHGERPAGA